VTAPVTAIILAGRRPGPDPLLDGALLTGRAIATKALLPIATRPMLLHVTDALLTVPDVGSVIVLAQDSAALRVAPEFAALSTDPRIDWVEADRGISQSLKSVIKRLGEPVLVTTADNVLLTPDMVTDFLQGAAGSDVAVALVDRRTLMARYPLSQRTWLKFRGGWWSGANLFWMGGRDVLPLLDFWASIEQDRKKGLKIIAAFGPWLLLGTVLRLLSVQAGVRRAGLRFGLDARVVPMRQAEACIDADKPAGVALIETIFAARRAALAAAAAG
jgi:GTP:adenosylcobinamide-phosphate guanylyltransferase